MIQLIMPILMPEICDFQCQSNNEAQRLKAGQFVTWQDFWRYS